jgi:hypothetical protein
MADYKNAARDSSQCAIALHLFSHSQQIEIPQLFPRLARLLPFPACFEPN